MHWPLFCKFIFLYQIIKIFKQTQYIKFWPRVSGALNIKGPQGPSGAKDPEAPPEPRVQKINLGPEPKGPLRGPLGLGAPCPGQPWQPERYPPGNVR